MRKKIIASILLTVLANYVQSNSCVPKWFNKDSFACVCTEWYCDSLDLILPEDGKYLMVTTDKASERFAPNYGYLFSNKKENYEDYCMDYLKRERVLLSVQRDQQAQSIVGFGGAFTDAVGANLNKVSQKLVDAFYDAYFGKKGLDYNMVRTTIGHSDYSPELYYYTKDNDDKMKSWKLQKQDYVYRIPHLKKIKKLKKDVRFFCSIWSAPSWMTEPDNTGYGVAIKESMYSAYSLYIINYLKAMKKEGLEMWGVSYANEPTFTAGMVLYDNQKQIYSVWAMNQLANFLTKNFGPDLKKNKLDDIKVLLFDDTRDVLMDMWLLTFLKTSGVEKYMDHVALHSYSNTDVTPKVINNLKKQFKNATVITTELSTGQQDGVQLGAWSRAEYYVTNYLQELNHHTSGWVDWNLALGKDGGPHYIGPDLDAAIIIDSDNKVFYKQPAYYAIGHFSRFMPPGSKYLGLKVNYASDLEYAAVLRPDGLIAVVLYNKSNFSVTTRIKDDVKGSLEVTINANSINTIVF